ncbi:MAG: type III-A CRISPR-associated protein Csm2 [Methylomicrobium sp.]
MATPHQQRQGHGFRGGYADKQERPLDTSKIVFKGIEPKALNPDLFNQVASDAAETIADTKKELNKPTQLRRFYDEIVMWESKASMNQDKFSEYLPFIRMINAKVAYALGRGLVDKNFVEMMSHGLKQVETYPDLRHFKLFLEAFMGFYKQKRPN